MHAPIKYFGGKGNMLNQILKQFPLPFEYSTFIDAFGGAGTVFLAKQQFNHVEIFNDLDENIYSLYHVIADKELFKEFKEKCDKTFYMENLRKEFKQKLKHNHWSVVDRAFMFFYVNRTSYNGIGGFSINTCICRKMSKSTSDYLSSIDRLPELHNRLSSVIITKQDGLKLLDRYDNKDVFFYLDPPYHPDTRTSVRYFIDMSGEQHEQFINKLVNIKNAKILLSGYNCLLYDKLCQNGYNRIDFIVKTTNGKHQPKEKTESLWKNY